MGAPAYVHRSSRSWRRPPRPAVCARRTRACCRLRSGRMGPRTPRRCSASTTASSVTRRRRSGAGLSRCRSCIAGARSADWMRRRASRRRPVRSEGAVSRVRVSRRPRHYVRAGRGNPVRRLARHSRSDDRTQRTEGPGESCRPPSAPDMPVPPSRPAFAPGIDIPIAAMPSPAPDCAGPTETRAWKATCWQSRCDLRPVLVGGLIGLNRSAPQSRPACARMPWSASARPR